MLDTIRVILDMVQMALICIIIVLLIKRKKMARNNS